jgi:hypothetical protein
MKKLPAWNCVRFQTVNMSTISKWRYNCSYFQQAHKNLKITYLSFSVPKIEAKYSAILQQLIFYYHKKYLRQKITMKLQNFAAIHYLLPSFFQAFLRLEPQSTKFNCRLFRTLSPPVAG